MVGENEEIPIDFESVLSLEAFLGIARERESLELREMIPGPDEVCARGPEGRYVHELLVPFVGTTPAPARPLEPLPRPAKRTFLPGSEWLYAKLYGGNVALDHALVRSIGPLAESVLASGGADSWFFVRYADPRPHLRVRFHGDPRRLRDEVLPELSRTAGVLRAGGEIWRMQVDTYEREIERYGGIAGIELAERVFHVDSDAVLSILGMLEEGEAGQDERWRIAHLGCDALLDDLGLSFDEKRAFVRHARTAYGLGRLEDPELKRTLGERYRQESRDLRVLLERKDVESSPLRPGLDVLADRSRRLAPLLTALREADSAGELDRPLRVVGGSLVHMFLNRMFPAGHRRQELVVYEFLDRLYGAVAAIARSGPAERIRA
jgi:thiopeptide-type bacteriocin biosynthesis protein